jgi:tRNA splicing ligase
LTAGEAKNVDNAVVLARLFNEASGQKVPSKKRGLFISRPYGTRIILCIASLRKLFLAAAGAKQDGQKSGFILFAFL